MTEHTGDGRRGEESDLFTDLPGQPETRAEAKEANAPTGPGRFLAAAGTATAAAAGAGVAAVRSLPRLAKVVVGVVVLALVGGLVLFWPGPDKNRVTAHFVRTVGLYPGSEVRILGIGVGEVLEVTPEGESVRVVLEYDAEYEVPADARAAVISPAVVSDRFVQLLPVYSEGDPVMQDGAEIPLDRTAVPVELDRIYSSLDDLMVALGPEGANSEGALTRVLETGAANLDGQGEQLNQTVSDLSQALGTLSGGEEDLFSTVKNLQVFTTTLAENDQDVRTLNANLATVSDQLAAERDDLALALKNLAIALQEVSTFVQDNRQVLGDDIKALEEVTAVVASQQAAVAETLSAAPTALSNLQMAYNNKSGTLDTRNNDAQVDHPDLFVCSLLSGALEGEVFGDPVDCQQGGGVATLLEGLLAAGPLSLSGLPLGQLSRVPSAPGTQAAVGAPDPTLGGILSGEGAP